MRLYDEHSGELRPIDLRPRMGIYVCGITPYDSAHIGHAFTYTHFDVLVRYLRHQGIDVVHVQNVTNVDDDILRVAKERGEDYQELAEREVKLFEDQMGAIGILRPTHSPRATEYVPAMIEEVQSILAAGRAYERNGTVYFRVSSDPGYGRLSRLSREEMLKFAAERGGHPEDPNKDDPLDFVLWQAQADGEPSWESPWGPGRPGWHIECSTMARRFVGQPVDIHGGGSDLIFPHHESELAQAEAVPGERPFVRHWMHTGTVHMGGQKMSKSLGNLAFVGELVDRYGAETLRRALLSHHYREDWSFDEGELSRPSVKSEGQTARASFIEALDNDLDTPRAVAILDRAESAGEDWAEEGRSVLGLDL